MNDTSRHYRIEKLVPGGLGLTRDEDGVLFVRLAAPGDLVSLRDIVRVRGVRQASIDELIEAGPGRVEPDCRVYGLCGGCNLMHLSYEAQLEAKAAMLREALQRQGGMEPGHPLLTSLRVRGTEPFGSRNRFSFFPSSEGPGLRARRSSRVVPLNHCPVAHPEVNRILADPQFRERLTADPADRNVKMHTGAQPGAHTGARPGGKSSGRGRRDTGTEPVTVFGSDSASGWGEGSMSCSIRGIRMEFDIESFFQSTLSALEQLLEWFVATVEELGGEGPYNAQDLYCGSGLFARFLPPACSHILGVEIDPRSAARARVNLGTRGELVTSSLEDWVRHQSGKTDDHGTPPRFIIVDPPRTGLSPDVRQYIKQSTAPYLIYISCDPVSFSRDVKDLSEAYGMKDLQAFDFSPQNDHFECAALFVHGAQPVQPEP